MIGFLKFSSDNPFRLKEVYVKCRNQYHMDNIVYSFFSYEYLQWYLIDKAICDDDDAHIIPDDAIILE